MYNATTRNTPRRRSSRIVFIVLITRYQQNNDRYCTRKEPQRDKLERLARYIARPAIASAWLKLTDSGQSRYTLKTPYRDGTTQVIFESGDFIARLAALVPKPHAYLTRHHGVFAPASPDRAHLVPKHCAAAASERGIGHRSATDAVLGATPPAGVRH